MSRKLLIALLGVGLCALQAVQAATYDDSPLSVVVRFADLDVSRDAGAATLYSRIRWAAQRVCAPLAGRSLDARVRRSACIDKAVVDAVGDVAAPRLTRLHERATGRDIVPETHVAVTR